MKHLKSIVGLIVALMLSTACNIDSDEGIFRQISKTEAEVEVGMAWILKLDGPKLYAHTAFGGLQSYNRTTKTWTRLDQAVAPVTNSMASSTGEILFTRTADGTTGLNTWFQLNGSDIPEDTGVDRAVVTTSHHGGWELAKGDTAGSFHLYRDAAAAAAQADLHTLFSPYPWVLVSDPETVLISGLASGSSTLYTHRLYVGGALTTVDAEIQESIVAFNYTAGDGKMVAVTSSGKVWKGTAADMAQNADSISFPTNGVAGKPIPTFIDGSGNLVFQGSSVFYSISIEGTVSQISDVYAQNLRASTFKVTSLLYDAANGDLYGGSAKNGLFVVEDLNADEVQWL